jgi:adenylate cyclase
MLLRVIASGSCLLIVVFAALWRPTALELLDLRAYDHFSRRTPPDRSAPGVAVVAVDEPSMTRYGQWPWPRETLAKLVDHLRAMGAASIAFDVLFTEPDRLDSSGYRGPVDPDSGTLSDATLEAALAAVNAVTSYAFVFDRALPAVPCATHPVDLVEVDRGVATPTAHLFQASGIVCSLGFLTQAAGGSGFINAATDADGLLRRVPLLIRYDGRIYPSLALAAVRRARETGPLVLTRRADRSLALSLEDRTVGLDEQARLWLRFSEGGGYEHLSAAAILEGNAPAHAIRDRVVFVGATAMGLRDVVATPVQRALPGVDLHAMIADGLLRGVVNSRPEFAGLYELAAILAAGLVVAVVAGRFGLIAGGGAALGIAALLWWGSAWLLAAHGWWVSPSFALLAIALVFLADVGVTVVRERQRGDRAQRRTHDAQQLIVQALTSLTETRDRSTGRHARRTQEYTRVLATALSRRQPYRRLLSREHIDLISTLAPLHDIGKVGVSDAVLRKPGALTDEEFAEMRRHPGLGHESLLKAEALAGVRDDEVIGLAKEIVHTHHEHWDGSGYPQGLTGSQIPLSGRLVALVDAYDAMVADRAYRQALTHEHAVEAIRAARGHHFDPDIVDAFLTVQGEFKRLSQLKEQSADG